MINQQTVMRSGVEKCTRVHRVSYYGQIVILNCMEMSQIFCLRKICLISGILDCQSQNSELNWV